MLNLSPGMLIYAVRYAIGRQSYASNEVAQEVLKHAAFLDAHTKASIIRDIHQALLDKRVSGPDLRGWESALEALSAPVGGPPHA